MSSQSTRSSQYDPERQINSSRAFKDVSAVFSSRIEDIIEEMQPINVDENKIYQIYAVTTNNLCIPKSTIRYSSQLFVQKRIPLMDRGSYLALYEHVGEVLNNRSFRLIFGQKNIGSLFWLTKTADIPALLYYFDVILVLYIPQSIMTRFSTNNWSVICSDEIKTTMNQKDVTFKELEREAKVKSYRAKNKKVEESTVPSSPIRPQLSAPIKQQIYNSDSKSPDDFIMFPIRRRFEPHIRFVSTYLSFAVDHFEPAGMDVQIHPEEIKTAIWDLIQRKQAYAPPLGTYDEHLTLHCILNALIHLRNADNDYIGIPQIEEYLKNDPLWKVPQHYCTKVILKVVASYPIEIETKPSNTTYVRITNQGVETFQSTYQNIDPSILR